MENEINFIQIQDISKDNIIVIERHYFRDICKGFYKENIPVTILKYKITRINLSIDEVIVDAYDELKKIQSNTSFSSKHLLSFMEYGNN